MTLLQDKIREFNIPVVSSRNPVTDPMEFISFVRSLEDEEGFVVCWDTGHRIKLKAESYLRKHKAKDSLSHEKNVVDLIVNSQLDDIKAFLDEADLARISKFEAEFWKGVGLTVEELLKSRNMANTLGLDVDQRTYAVEFVQKQDPKFSQMLYKMKDPSVNVLDIVRDAIAHSVSTQTKVDSVRWMFNANWQVSGEIE